MSHTLSLPLARRSGAGWAGVAAIALLYAAMYGLNYWLPLQSTNYTTRIWDWSQAALSVAGGVAVLRYRRVLTPRTALIGLALGLLSGLAHTLRDPSFWWNAWQGVGVWVCFAGGAVLFQAGAAPRIAGFEPPPARIAWSLAAGIALAMPLAIINNLYFYTTSGAVQIRNPFASAFAALSPGIHEEVIFRFFVLALCLHLLRYSTARRLALIVAVGLAVVPHSLNHLPDLLLANPTMGIVMLMATCLLFGLPMAVLQVRRNLETAIAFHWWIDFVRFLFGF